MVNRFNRSEFGLVPSDWISKKFSDLIIEFRGGAPLTPSDFKKNGVKVLPKLGVIRGGFLNVNKEKHQYCSNEYANLHKSNLVDQSFTIIVLRDLVPSGPNIGLMVSISSTEPYILAQGVYGIKFTSAINHSFLIHLSNTNEYRRVMRNIMVGSTQVHITNSSFLKVEIPLPPTKAEQSAIAEALSDTDKLIASIEKLIEKKRLVKKGAIQSLIKPRSNWISFNLGEIATIIDGTHQTPTYVSNGIPFFSVENISSNDFVNTKFITKEEHDKISRTLKICKGDILMTRIGSIGVCKIVDWEYESSFYVSLALIKLNKILSAEYFYQYSMSKFFQTEIERNSLQFAYPMKINLGEISKVKISFPKEKAEQTRIANILSDMDAEIEALEKKLEKYKLIKQGMMQQLLTGRIRLV